MNGYLAAGAAGYMTGGSFGRGFVAAGIGSFVGAQGLTGIDGFIAASLAGGIASEITGGKFANGASTAAFMWALRAGAEKASDKFYSDSGSGNGKNKHTKNGGRPTGRNSFSEEKIKEIDALIDKFSEELVGTMATEGDVKSTAVKLTRSGIREEITDVYGIEVGAIMNSDGTIAKIGTDYHYRHIASLQTYGGQSFWHTHPSGGHLSGNDIVNASRWVFADMGGGKIQGFNMQGSNFNSVFGKRLSLNNREIFNGYEWKVDDQPFYIGN